MRKFISRSDKFSLILTEVIGICFLLSGCHIQARTEAFASKEGYLITISEDPTEKDTRWAKYLYDHLQKRAKDEEMIAFGVSDKDMCRIIIKIDADLPNDYCITNKGKEIKLTASDDKKMLWLQYQLIKKISKEDPRIDGTDLPPAIISLNDTCGSFSFDYQSIYSPAGLDADFSGITGLDNFDNSWGIWGHNLRKVLGANAEKVYATINGKKNDTQLCFSSEEMYRQIESYIIDNYGEKDRSHFVIAPDDNPLACTCPTCIAFGNTATNATPAVTGLITRLSERFPSHLFFTISYLSTQKATDKQLPPNAGIIVSTIDFPLRMIKNDAKEKDFIQRLKQWKKVTKNIYIWDYINNFDDYLTPFPILKIAQQRLQLFQKHGASGIFFNGSGYNYTSLDKMRTFVLSALLINPALSVDELVKSYLNQEYPSAKEWLHDYYINLENNTASGKNLLLYAGIQESEKAYLHPEEFIRFYDKIGDFVKKAKGTERKKLHELQTALSFTRLELGRNHGADLYGYAQRKGKSIHPTTQSREWLTQLKEHKAFPKMESYNESGDEIDRYIKEWEQYIFASDISSSLLAGIIPSVTPKWEDNNTDFSILTDGTHGLPGNYHFGWVIIPKNECTISLPVKDLRISGTLYLSFLDLPEHRIYVPQKMELSKDGVFYKSIDIKSESSDEKGKMIKVKVPVNLDGTDHLQIKVLGTKGERAQIALDEIALIP